MFSCLWHLWDWFDPNKMEKDAKQPPDNNNRQQPTLGSTIPQQVYQPNTTLPHYYPKSHQHQPQPPFLLNISPGQQMLHATAHRHFQYYPQYAAQQGDSSVHIHRHVPWTNNQPFTPATNKEPTPAQKQVEQKENAKESTSRASKQKVKEGEKKQLRSPSARRPPDARVTMQGWLHKQGSEGLMLWKKRWFVLSEYCLFYYKGSSEDKLLGSILLPSYKVSICGPEDKVNKKFAFKCEHVNMRTYILAADSQELMLRWIHVLNLACNLQSNTDVDQCRDSQTAGKQTNPHAVYVNKPNNGNRGSLHTHTSSNMTDLSNSSQQELSQYNQPLYVNAPPKPRRLTDGFSSPTPDSDTFGLQHGTRAIAKSPLFVYDKQLHSHQQIAQPECVHIYNERPSLPQNVDRRTPDSYGRSKFMRSRNPIDYEDIYSEQAMYKRPLSPVVANDVLRKGYPPNANCVYKGYAPHSEFKQREIFRYDPQKVKAAGLPISRPHSADFLEYKGNQNECDESPVALIQARPKSSLDINMYSDEKNSHVCNEFTQPSRQSNPSKNDSDNYFYSQERYAENMRKSAQYLQKLPIKYQPIDPHQQRHEERYNMNSPNNLSAPHDLRYNPQPAQSRSVLSDGTLLCSHDIDDGSYRGDFSVKMEQHCHHNFLSPNQEQFIRSASARLAQAHEDSMLEEKMLSIEGERKREESMKRLLEWKQRMLQSPLNRKVQGHRATKEQSYMAEGSHHSIEKKQKRPNLNSRKPAHHLVQYNSYSSDDEASGSISINTRAASISHRDTFPRAASAKRQWELNFQNPQARSITELDQCFNKYSVSSRLNHSSKFYGISGEDSRVSENDLTTNKNKMNVTAGELLGRTHEELVLLLIQLRRQQAQTFQAIESCYNEIETLQVNMHNKDQNKRMENLQKLERIKQNLIELEKQYEKGKPLVNLVDNMVKLGSLYRIPMEQSNETARHIRDRIEFNQHVQEERLLAEEKREWERLETSQAQLQAKVKQLYQLDSLIQEESRNLHNLQRDKEDIERALGGLRCRLVKGFNNPEEIEQARRQQMALENELSRVHFMLAQNSKKLEETVAGNARLEQELLILKQKFQVSKQPRTSPHFSHPGDSLPYMTDSNVAFETDLERVQKKIGDLQKQREELRLQVRQLTDKSNSPHLHQMKQHSFTTNQFNYSKKKPVSVWRETDLDTMSNIDHSCYNYASTPTKPLYINTNTKSTDGSAEYVDPSQKAAELGNDDTLLSSNMLERPEIKTVRIVKRESERRQRDREKTFTEKCDILAEEDDNLLTKLIPSQAQNYFYDHHSLPTPSKSQKQKTSELSPVFKSEAAKQIITEMSKKGSVPQRRAVPREKRRHYTTPHDQLAPFGSLESRRARDDLDIERALRQRIDAPDIVRSTLSNKELKYNENTIDSILSTPNKIVIPERYIPEQLPQPSAEEQERRMKKVESIKKMLSDTTIISSTITTATDDRSKKPSPISKTASSSNIVEEKKQREHLLQLNQILAKQVMEISKAVAAKTLEKLPLMKQPISTEDEDSSPVAPLPLYQQRENFYS